GSGSDDLDLSSAPQSVYIGSATNGFLSLTSAPFAVEVYSSRNPIVQIVQFIYNVFVPSGEPSSGGLTDPTGLRFSNFEHVIGSPGDDTLGLWRLNPGGELTAEQEQALKAAQNITVTFSSGNPAQIGAALDARMEQAR